MGDMHADAHKCSESNLQHMHAVTTWLHPGKQTTHLNPIRHKHTQHTYMQGGSVVKPCTKYIKCQLVHHWFQRWCSSSSSVAALRNPTVTCTRLQHRQYTQAAAQHQLHRSDGYWGNTSCTPSLKGYVAEHHMGHSKVATIVAHQHATPDTWHSL